MNMIIRSKVKPECVDVEAGVKKMFAAIEQARGGLEAVGHERVPRAALPGDRRVRPVRDDEDRVVVERRRVTPRLLAEVEHAPAHHDGAGAR